MAIVALLFATQNAYAVGEINYYIVCNMNHALDHGFKGEIYHYGTYTYDSHVVRSLYLTSWEGKLWTYGEVGQLYYKGIYTPTRHFYAYEDDGYTDGQRLFTYGNCTLQTWFSYYIEQDYPIKNAWKVGRTGVPWATVTLHMSGGCPESSMERSSTRDDGHGMYRNLQYKGPGPTTWTPSEAPLEIRDNDPSYKAVRKSYGSWESAPS